MMTVIDADHARMCYHIARWVGGAYCAGLTPTQRIEGDVLVARHTRSQTIWVLTADNQLAMRVHDPRTGSYRWYAEPVEPSQ